MSGVQKYEGRLVTSDIPDGIGRLYADDGKGFTDEDGEIRLKEVAFDPDTSSFIFVLPGSPSHNQRHSTSIANIQGTTDDDAHHFGPTEDDPHYFPGAPNNTRLKFNPDYIGPKVTGHTEAYKS